MSGFLASLHTNVTTVFSSAQLASLPVVAAPDIMAVVFDPLGIVGLPEIVWVTAHSSGATTATILRGQEGSAARQHNAGTIWIHAPTTPADYPLEWTTGDAGKVARLNAAETGYELAHVALKSKSKTAGQNFTDTTFITVTADSGNLAHAVEANTKYHIHGFLYFSSVGTAGSDGLKIQFLGPAAPTDVQIYIKYPHSPFDSTGTAITATQRGVIGTAFSTPMIAENVVNSGVAPGVVVGVVEFDIYLNNGANAGTVTCQVGQNTNGAGTTTIGRADSTIERLIAE